MSASSMSVKRTSAARPPAGDRRLRLVGLRRLRGMSILVVLLCAAALPVELGVIQIPNLPWEKPVRPGIVSVQNYPRTAVLGHTERFSVRLAGMPHARLTYVLWYPDNAIVRANVRADAQGYSSHTFRLKRHYRLQSRREVAWIGVVDVKGTVQASLRFALQKP